MPPHAQSRTTVPVVSARRGLPLRLVITALVATVIIAGCSPAPEASAPVAPAPAPSSAGLSPTPPCAGVLPEGYDYEVPPGAEGDAGAVLTFGQGSRGVVLAPQSDGDVCQWLAYGEVLAGRGYRVATFTWSQPTEAALISATRRIRDLGARRVVLVGASQGGAYALAYAARLAPVGVVSLSGEASLDGLDNDRLIRAYRGPLLLLGSEDDGYTPGDATRLLAKNHPDDEQVVIVDGSAHGVELLDDDAVQAALTTFLQRHL